jgi:hypothetical protein
MNTGSVNGSLCRFNPTSFRNRFVAMQMDASLKFPHVSAVCSQQ